MAIKEIRRAQLIKGGDIIKQGETFTLGFRLFDANDRVIQLGENDAATVKIANTSGVIANLSAQKLDDYIEFTVNQDIGYGEMRVEITISNGADVQKYPARDWIILDITKTLDDLAVGNINAVTVTQLKNEQRLAQEAFENEIVPQLEQLQGQFNEVLNGANADGEVQAARIGEEGSFGTIGGRMDFQMDRINRRIEFLSEKVIYTVGPGGNFATINEALEKLSTKYPAYRFNSNDMGIDLMLKSGFMMQEQVFVSGLNLSHFNVLSEDDEVTIDRQFLSTALGSVARYPAWAFSYGAISPKFYSLFNMNETGPSEQRNGFNVRLGATIQMENGSGCKNAYRGLHIANGGGYANGTIFTGSKQAGIRCANSGKIWAEGVDVSNSLIGFMMDEGEVKARYAKADNCDTAIRAVSSDLDFKFGRALNCGTVLSADEMSEVLMSDSDCKYYTTQGLFVTGNCDVVADRIDLNGGTGRALNINDSELMARFSKLVPTTDDLSLSSTTSRVNITSAKTKRVSTLHSSNVIARNVDASAYTLGNAYSLSGVGNDLNIQGSNGTVGFPTNQLVSVGIIHK